MSFLDFLAQVFNRTTLVTIGAVIALAATALGSASAVALGGDRIAEEFGWGWNLLYIPAVFAATWLVALFIVWFTVEVAL